MPFHHHHQEKDRPNENTSKSSAKKPTIAAVARALLPCKRRLRLDPQSNIYFPYEPGKQLCSAIKIVNITRSNVAFKFLTTAPKSCFMRPPSAMLTPGESIIATIFKFIEPPERPEEQHDRKSKDKFKIVSLKMREDMDYSMELFEEQREAVTVEQVLRVVFLDPQKPSPELEKLKRQLAEAEAAAEARKKPPTPPLDQDAAPPRVGEGLVIDEWKELREKYLAQQQGDSGGNGENVSVIKCHGI